MKNSLIAIGAAGSIAAVSHAGIFVSTGHTGAQVQCDSQHTQHWTYSVSQDVADISGGLFTMKRGSATTELVEFVIFEGLYSDFGSVTSLLSVSLGPDDFTTQFTPTLFASTPIELLSGHTYTAVLFSQANDPQSEAYFIKGGGETPLALVTENGDPWTGGGDITPPLPAPGAIALLGITGVAFGRRRRAG